MSIYWSYILFIVGFFDFILGLIVFLRDPRKLVNIAFMSLSVSLSLWVVGIAIFGVAPVGVVSFWAAKLFYAAPLIVSLALIYTSYLFPAGRKLSKKSVIIPAVPVIVMTILILAIPDFITLRIEQVSFGKRVVVNLYEYLVYSVVVSGSITFAIYTLLRKIPTLRGRYKQQTQWLSAMLVVVAGLGLWFNLVLPHWLDDYRLIWVGPLATTIYVVSNVISIVRHKLFDIKFAVVRAITYFLALVALASIYYAMAYLVSVALFRAEVSSLVSISPVNILLALVLAFMFQPVKRFFDRLTDDVFYKDNYKPEEFFARLSSLLTSTTDLRGLLERSSYEIAATFKAEQVFFQLYYTNGTEHHLSAGTPHHSKMPMYDARMLDIFTASMKDTLQLTEMLPDDSDTRRMLVSHKIALFMPLKNNGKILGYIFLGEHRSGLYTRRDMNVLSTVANEFVIAIQNALSLHEVREINATLQQRIDMATKELRSSNAQLRHLDEVKDEFMSMASHQLRTPLTSVKGYLSMVIEGDVGDISGSQRKLLTEAYDSSERMVRLIADFLNVSRIQTGKFVIEKAPVDMKKLVHQEVNNLDMIAKSHDMKLRFSAPDQPLMVIGDESKIRQVVMNFIDNSIYYSHPNTTINIMLEKEGDNVVYKVIDTGIGVPKAEQDQLFTKFFRAKNARQQRPDGTGVGLFLGRKVIMSHGGDMVFSSEEGKGSTFGFKLPLMQEESAEVN